MCHLHSIDLIQFLLQWALQNLHPSIQTQNEIQKKQFRQKVWYIPWARHPSRDKRKSKKKNNLCQGLIQVSREHPSIQGQGKSKKKTIYAKVSYIPAACIHPSTDIRKSRKNNLCQGLIYSICTHPSPDKGKQERTILCKGLIISISRVVGWPFSVLFPSAHRMWL